MFEFLSGLGTVGIIGGVLLFVAVILIVVGVSSLFAEQEFMQHRLAVPQQEFSGGAKLRITLEDGVLKQFENLVTPKSIAELQTIRRRLIQAGYRNPSAVRVYYTLKATLALSMAVLGAITLPLLPFDLPLPIFGLGIVASLFLGYFMPDYWVERQIETRKQEAELGFPDLLDMLLICMEAGNGLDQACRRVAREINKVNKVLADELGVVNDELYAGKSRPAVFRDFADRIGVQDISAFAAVLRQSDEFGVSIADTLRIYS
ncbi:MAG TPA: type II secretion system F family protein, partial [Micropepsaceae bacterium]|nr:type II secretion system F family protein [Micropepsaceae bacterium]